jgi:uncharacterized membrane protein YqjE
MAGTQIHPGDDRSVGQLVTQLSEELTHLIRDELRLAQLELARKTKRVGIGAGMFGGAGVFVWFGVATLVACAVLSLAIVWPAWLAALAVGVALFLIAGVLVLVGKRQVSAGTPPMPREALDGVKKDVAVVRDAAAKEHARP